LPSTEPSPYDLGGRRIVITGAAGGIGAATARLCVKQGATVVLVDRLERDAIEARVGDLGGQGDVHSLDTSDRGAVTALAAAVGPVFGLIDCAAICPEDDWMDDDWDDALDRVIAANIKGPLHLTRAFFPGMVERKAGRIVLCGSVAGWMGGVRSGPHYAFSKGGMHAFVRWLSRRGAPHGVLVNGIAPGPVDTGMIAGRGYEREAYPLGRMGRPEEIAGAAVFLCGGGASYMSGAIMDVNGGVFFH
jgi:NAD(P)-dependent dehydrogenase (short-subunit alcohol dehydrogenase family)